MSSLPAISVLMTAYNAEATVGRAIESILSQSFEDFEFIIVNDGSSDGTLGVIKSYAKRDSRIRVIDQANMGVSRASNRGLRDALGEFVARIDADDISLPHRLRVQYEVMRESSDIVLTGSECIKVFADGYESKWNWLDERSLGRALFLRAPFAHSTVMFRLDSARSVGCYDESFDTTLDMELYMRLAGLGRVLMVKDVLVRLYILESGISMSRPYRQYYNAQRARWRHNSYLKRPYALYYGYSDYYGFYLKRRGVILRDFLRGLFCRQR